MEYRHEWTHAISWQDALAVRQNLRAAAAYDAHAQNGRYTVCSLYFDTPSDRALREKLDGVSRREKFRIRYYNDSPDVVHLEKKCKLGDLCRKLSAPLTAEQARAIAAGETGWMRQSPQPLVRELYGKLTWQLLRPRTLVRYTREPFVYAPGNVRVTLDYDICTALGCTELFAPPECFVRAPDTPPVLLEVKWDAFLPESIRRAVALKSRSAGAFSKYAQCRLYG